MSKQIFRRLPKRVLIVVSDVVLGLIGYGQLWMLATKSNRKPQELRIGILCAEAIGDLVLTTPLIREIRQAKPSATIILVVQKQLSEFAEDTVEGIDLVVPLFARQVQKTRLFGKFVGLCGQIHANRRLVRQLDLDVIVVARRDVDEKHASLLALLSGAAVRIGFSSRNIPSKHLDFVKDRYFTNLVDFPTERILRESDAILRASSFFAAPKTFSRTKLKIQSKALENADNILARSDRTKVAVALGANSGRRRWPIKNFVASIEELNSHFDLDFILIGSKADKCAAQQLENDTTARVTNCCGITDLQTSAAIISRCRLTLCNDSGPLHISEAVGTPVVSISCHPKGGNDYHANSPKRFGPALPESICHQPPTHLSPCRNGCKSLVAHCICLVTPETVTQSASEILARTVNSEQWQDD